MKPTHKLINAQVNKRDKCLGLTTASPEINQGIITYFEPYRIGFGSSSIWSCYYIVIMRNTSLADMGKHSAAKAALNILFVFNYTDVPFHSLLAVNSLTCILTVFPTLSHALHVDVLHFWSGH